MTVAKRLTGPVDELAARDAQPELILHREEVTVVKRVVPYERVRISKKVVADAATVEDTVQTERIDVSRAAGT